MSPTYRLSLGALCAVATMAASFGYGAQQPPLPKIRDFDIATIQRLGKEIYAQDQLAWKATDVALAQRGGERGVQRDGMKGWITESLGGNEVVRMIRVNRGRPEVLYDVTFAPGAAPVFSTPEDHTLNAEEISQYNARVLALDNIGRARCADRYNTVALKDPESDGWLVWALASAQDADTIITRGHYRFTISADGKTLRQKDALSAGCQQYSKRAMQREAESRNGTPATMLTMTHIVSPRPVETYVFTSLSYPYTLFVGTSDGEAYKFEKDNVTTVADDAPDPDGISARALHGAMEQCVGVATNPSQTPRRYYPTKTVFKVIQVTEHDQAFNTKLDGGFEIVGVICSRTTIIPSPNDYKILVGETKLSIEDAGDGHPKRTGELARVDGKITFEIKEGQPLTDELRAKIDARLQVFNVAIQNPK